MDLEEAVFDQRVSWVLETIERLEQLEDLVTTTEPLRPHASSNEREVTSGLMRNQERPRHLKNGINKDCGTVRLLKPTPYLNV